jgi:hypothetical protein
MLAALAQQEHPDADRGQPCRPRPHLAGARDPGAHERAWPPRTDEPDDGRPENAERTRPAARRGGRDKPDRLASLHAIRTNEIACQARTNPSAPNRTNDLSRPSTNEPKPPAGPERPLPDRGAATPNRTNE